MPIDDRTTNRSYKLPNAGNFLAEDVARLREALTAIDADVYARYTKTEVDQLIANLINGAPGALDTLNELAAAMGDDPNFAATVTNSIAAINTALGNRYTKTESDARYVQGAVQTEMVITAGINQVDYTLTTAIVNKASALLTVDGVVQPTSEYSLSMDGLTLTLSEAPAQGATIRVLALGVASSIGTPGDDTVTTPKLRNGAVTGPKLGADVQAVLGNIEGNLNFTTLAPASQPIADEDLLLVRQGTANKKVTASIIRTELAADANLAKTGAEAARDAAFVNAAVYASTAAGLAATAVGGQFQVVAGEEIIRYREDAGPVATEVARYPAASKVNQLQSTNLAILAVEDADGNLGIDIQSPLRISEDGSIETSAFLEETKPVKWTWAISDLDGNIPLGVDHLGRLVADFSLVSSTAATTLKTGGTYDYTVNHVFCYGQSLSVGQALPIQSGTSKYDHLMFTRGMRPQYDYPAETAAQWYASLVPAVEAVSPQVASLGETPSRGTGDAIKELIATEDGKAYTDHEYKLLLSAPGYGATTISQLSKGSSYFSRMVQQAQYGLSLANAQGDTYAVQAVTWIQGESDYISNTTQSAYLSSLNTLVADIQTDLKAATGQTKAIPVIGYQVASHINYAADDIPDIALAQLECAEDNANFYIATPMYHLPYGDGGHLTGPGSQWLGAYLGLAYKRIVIDREDWSPVRPVSSVRQGSVVEVRFHVPKGRLVFDTTSVASQANKGFQLVDSADAPLTISNVEIVDFDRVRITAAGAIPAGAKLRYAWQGDSARGIGNLRDTQGNSVIFDPQGVNRPLHNWCVIFQRSF